MIIKPKYLVIIGLLCAGLTTLARADVVDLFEHDIGSNGDPQQTAFFQSLSGDTDAVLCFKDITSGSTSFGGTITIAVNPDDTLHVEWDMTGTGHVVCGFGTKDGAGTVVHFYQVLDVNGQGTSGSFDLEVPGNGADSLSSLAVYCCPGGVTTPDSGTTAMLLGGALAGLGVVRRYLKR